jgi:glycosyltransferase involved in cell wall biosynthesis
MQAHPVRVSVIIPFFNTPEAFLREAVGSVLQQDSVSLELLLVNDGSDSVTTGIAEVLAEVESPRVRHLSHPGGINKGTSATRNLGVAHAIGEYVAFLDSDDAWRAGKLKEQTELLDELPDVAMIFGLSEYWYDWQQGEGTVPSGFIPDMGARKRRVLRPPQFVSDFLRGRIIVPNPRISWSDGEHTLRVVASRRVSRACTRIRCFSQNLGWSTASVSCPGAGTGIVSTRIH